jgi:carotenoid isomerooxygenase
MTETPKMRQFNPKTLETLDLVNLKDYTGIVFQPAHPVVAEDGSLYNIGLKMGSAGTQFIIFHIPNAENKFENMKIVAKFPPKRKSYPSYTHSFALTENFFVVIEQPFTMSVYELAKSIFKRTNFTDSFRWFEDEPVYVHLIDRKSGQIVHSYETETFFFFHTINAYEENGHVILDLTCYEGSEIVKSLMVENMRTLQNRPKTRMFTSRPLRYVFPLTYSADDKVDKNLITLNGSETKAYMQSSGTVLCFPEMLCDRPFEFGTLYYEKHYAKKYRYFYGVGMDIYSDFPGRLIKVDVETKKEWIWQEENVYPSEALFIPSPTATSEDDGVLVSALLRGKEDTNCVELLVLDAKTFKELGRSEFKDLPSPVTKTFHGWFLNERK